MTHRHLLAAAALVIPSLAWCAVPAVGSFFEPEQPFFHSQLEVTPPPEGKDAGGNFVVRGIVIPVGPRHGLVFDQELMRVAAIWEIPNGEPLTTLITMPQISYHAPSRKVGADHPEPTGPILLTRGMNPGVSSDLEGLFNDPRPPAREGDEGRGPLPVDFARFEGTELAGNTAVIRYRSGQTVIREWMEARNSDQATQLIRHFEVAAHDQPIRFAVGDAGTGRWTIANPAQADLNGGSAALQVVTNSPDFVLSEHRGTLVATLAPNRSTHRVSLAVITMAGAVAPGARLSATPPVPTAARPRLWTDVARSPVFLEHTEHNGIVVDRITVPEENPWKRRVRPADLAFFNNDRAAVVTYEGDVWIVEGFAAEDLKTLTWRRFASGLHEPLAIELPGGVIQVATKNGVVRLHDRDNNREADWFENFNDQLVQSKTTRSFPLDMAIGPDGFTYITQGGITTPSGIGSGGTGSIHTGAVLKISPDGRSSETFATGAREPYLTVHPKTGMVTATDQQGNWIPSSVVYHVRKGDHYGFLEDNPTKLTPPLVWIPHEQDISSSSQVWMIGEGMGPWNGKLLHLSYGTGRVLIITPDEDAPTPQGAAIPLDLRTDLPLLHGTMHPSGNSVYLTGFEVWGSRAIVPWGLVRLRPGTQPVTTAIAARSVRDGVILEFAQPLDPESLRPENVNVRLWNYQRSSAYGSGRYNLAGEPGTTAWGIAQAVPSRDRKSVFVHLPNLPPVMQAEVRHDFRLADGTPARGAAYFTIHEPHGLNLAAAGFPDVDMSKAAQAIVVKAEEPPSVEVGRTISESLGCIVCHSPDGRTEGFVGPTWQGLFGSTRNFVDGTSDVADEVYLREKILDPMRRRTMTAPVEMPSYRGVLTEQQLESVILYIKTLRAPRRGPPPAR